MRVPERQSAVSLGIQYVDAGGDPAAESALGSAMGSLSDEQRRRLTVATSITVDAAEAIAPAVQVLPLPLSR